MHEASATLQAPRIAEHLAGYRHEPQGSSAFGTAPDRAYRCQDRRWIGISVTNDEEWSRLRGCLPPDAIADESRVATNPARVANAAWLDEIIEPIVASHPLPYWIWALNRARVPFGIPLDFETLKNHRQALDNRYLAQVDTDAWGSFWVGGPPWRFSKTPAQLKPPPVPGDSTYELQEEVQQRKEGKL
jgi:crotonobetainyl-CoA:carnitine CoA-transferase CaiB-like acyl-CoA transferase